MSETQTLLARYTATGSEEAFRDLVNRYVNLVFSTAVRLVEGDAHRAEDVTQTVFADLARLARGLPADVMLGGWLHRRTCHVAATWMRGERRRRKRESQAMEMNALQDPSEAKFEELAPVLDEAINQLSAPDRTAVVLRFFEQQDLRAIGAALHTNEDAAQKRVSRALEKLRVLLLRRGVALSGVGLAAALTSQAVSAAPAGLGAAVATAAYAHAAATGAGLSVTFLKLMTMTKLQMTVGAVLVAGLSTTLVLEHQAQARLRAQNQALRQQMQQLARPVERSFNSAADTSPGGTLTEEQFRELLRLRGEVGLLRQQQAQWEKLRAENRLLQSRAPAANAGAAVSATNDYLPKESLSFAGYAEPEAALRSILWAGATLNGNAILDGFSPEQKALWLKEHKTPEGVAAQLAKNPAGMNPDRLTGFRILQRKATADDEVLYTIYVEGLNLKVGQKFKKVGAEWKFDGEFDMQ